MEKHFSSFERNDEVHQHLSYVLLVSRFSAYLQHGFHHDKAIVLPLKAFLEIVDELLHLWVFKVVFEALSYLLLVELWDVHSVAPRRDLRLSGLVVFGCCGGALVVVGRSMGEIWE